MEFNPKACVPRPKEFEYIQIPVLDEAEKNSIVDTWPTSFRMESTGKGHRWIISGVANKEDLSGVPAGCYIVWDKLSDEVFCYSEADFNRLYSKQDD